MPKLSPAMKRVLGNIAEGRHPAFGFPPGRSTAGGLSGTFPALYKRGLLGRNGQLTAAGREAAAKLGFQTVKEG